MPTSYIMMDDYYVKEENDRVLQIYAVTLDKDSEV